MTGLHFDEARAAAAAVLRTWLQEAGGVEKALLVRDLFGQFRLAVWAQTSPELSTLDERLRESCEPWWTGEILLVGEADEVTRDLYAKSWDQARPDEVDPRLQLLDRHRSRTGWFFDEEKPLWEARAPHPPLIVFYSFKGGLGRSTVLASFAIQRARIGDRVCVVDLDLDSPGLGRLLAADAEGLTSPRGVVDFLLEYSIMDTDLTDYFHRCDRIAGQGEIVVFPAGSLDSSYTDKLARVDFDEASYIQEGGLVKLLQRIRTELEPRWILIDARTGISEAAGRLLSGIAHLHVLLGTTQAQSWEGLRLVLDRLGKEHVEADRGQGDVVLVQAMVPTGEAGRLARQAFLAQSEREFTDHYYAQADADALWSMSDLDSGDAPHVPVPVAYDPTLADFGDIADVADDLCQALHARLGERVASRFAEEAEE